MDIDILIDMDMRVVISGNLEDEIKRKCIHLGS